MVQQGPRIGWIGAGRMGFELAARLLRAGCDVTAWNRTRSKAEPLAELGASIADSPADLSSCDSVCARTSTWGSRPPSGWAPRCRWPSAAASSSSG